jgi:integrase
MGRRKDARYGLPAGVHTVVAKGREYFYYQPYRGRPGAGPRVKLSGRPYDDAGTPDAEWWEGYRRLAGVEVGDKTAGTFGALIREYKKSPEWAQLSGKTREEWARYFVYVEERWGGLRVASVEPRHVLALRDSFADMPPPSGGKRSESVKLFKNRPAAANNLLRALSSMMTWSAPRGWIASNPCLGVKKLKAGSPYEPWSWEAICLLEEKARADLWQAAALALYSGQRQGDVLKMRWDDIRDGLIAVEQEKTGKKLWIPMHKALKRMLKTVKKRGEFILTNTRGEAWTTGFKAAWQNEMAREEFAPVRKQRYVFHGLRKSSVVMLLEAGCTDAEVAAITGQTREMVEHYARAVNQKKLAAAAILKWEALQAAAHSTRRKEKKVARKRGLEEAVSGGA